MWHNLRWFDISAVVKSPKIQLISAPKDLWLLLLWVAIAVILRFGNLGLKAVWGDEWATLVFSLGHSFRGIPLDQLISLETLITPLRYDATVPIEAVTEHLFIESNHPPLYYWITHLWLGLWSTPGDLISITVGRSPAALFGVLLVPLTFWILRWVTGSRRTAHLGAIAMAISPYAVYLSQEARHYTLAIIWMLLSYGIVTKLIQAQQNKQKPSLALLISWVVVNSLGIASHYFMLLTLFGEGLVLLYFYGLEMAHVWQKKASFKIFLPSYWQHILLGAIASGVSILLLMSQWQSNSQGELTAWLHQDYGWEFESLLPPVRSLGWLLGMIWMLPLEASQAWLVILSAITLGVSLIWLIPKLIRAMRQTWQQLTTRILVTLIVANICTILGITYLLDLDITLAPRYHFIYFPALILLLAIVLNYFWQNIEQNKNLWQQHTRYTAFIILGIMLISGVSVNLDLAYRKPENNLAIAPLLLAEINRSRPQILATHYYEIAVIRTQMGLAWALHQADPNFQPQFLILNDFQQRQTAPQILANVVNQLSEPTEILMFNTHFTPPESHCERLPTGDRRVTGYRYKKYLCRP